MAYHSDNDDDDDGNMKPVKLFTAAAAESEKTTTKVAATRSNRTFSIEISPIIKTRANFSDLHVVNGSDEDDNELESVEAAAEYANDRRDEYDEDQDDGIVISDEMDDDSDVGGAGDGDEDEDDEIEMNSHQEDERPNPNHDNSDEFRDDEYLDESDEESSLATTTSTTSTAKPKRRRLKSPSQNTQSKRRMYTTTSEKPKKQQQHANPLSFSHFMNFLKKIQNSFATRTAKSIGDKILILKRFRDSLIQSINRQIENLWKFRSPSRSKAELKAEHKKKKRVHRIQKRFIGSDDGGGGGGWVESGHGNGMAFPSAESALLSISFLTFAVFLIKLVLVGSYSIKYILLSIRNLR